ncbi:MAG: TrmH family RNA methyltransferase [Kiritimatiellia bacterium]
MTEARDEEQAVYGLRTCKAIFETRRDDIIRVFYRADRLRTVAPLLKWAAAQRRVYRELKDEELQRVAGGMHHEGLVMEVRPRFVRRFAVESLRAGTCWVAVDRVENPHNLGAIVRTCAFFGLEGLIMGGQEPGSRLSSAFLRMAEGGAERISLFATLHLVPCLEEMKVKGLAVIGLETDVDRKLGKEPLPMPACLVFGNENEGLSSAVRQACTGLVCIPGAWPGGSLNVSVSVGVALAALMRGQKLPARSAAS